MSEIVNGLVVVKYGSETVANDLGVDQEKIDQYASSLSALDEGLIVVTSGAVMIGRAEAPTITDDQVLAGLGTAEIVMAWKQAFRRFDKLASQVLATDHEIDDPNEGGMLRQALEKDIRLGIVPIFNTNDKLSAEELGKRKFVGENDGPAAHIAELMGAGTLCLMTKRNGLFDDAGDVIREVPFSIHGHNDLMEMIDSRGPSGQGIGAKARAAMKAASCGIDAYIAGAGESISKVLAGETGTHFVANTRNKVE